MEYDLFIYIFFSLKIKDKTNKMKQQADINPNNV